MIVQDLGLVRLIKKIVPDFEIHGSTQMTINNYMGAKFLEDLDFARVVLARELSVEEIKFIHDNTDIELEGFIHGALCVSYSGQCLMSSIIGGRSGNRGRCAQPCRMPYSILDLDKGEAIGKDFEVKYLLSPKDLNTIDHLDRIVDSGITSLKIEGRMKRPEYVATIVSNYKKALKALATGKRKSVVTEKDKKDITQIFNRGFTKGFVIGEQGKDFISLDKPNNRGIYIGKVTKIEKNNIEISLEDGVNKGDGIEFHNTTNTNKKNIGLTLNKMFNKDNTLSIPKINGVSTKSKVYKTSDLDLLSRAKATYTERENKFQIPVYMAVDISIGKPIKLYISDNIHHVTVESEELVEKARKVALTHEKVEEQMGKLGNTPYYLDDIQVNLGNEAMISVGVINKVRRKAIEELNQLRENKNKRSKIDRNDIKGKIESLFDYSIDKKVENKGNKRNNKKISISVSNSEQFEQLNLQKIDRIYLPLEGNMDTYFEGLEGYGGEVYILLDRIMSNKDFHHVSENLDKIDLTKIDGINVSNVGALKFIKDRYETKINGDIGLNIFNTSTVQLLKDYGVDSVTLSAELTKEQIKNICSKRILTYESVGYGYLPLMNMKHCPLSVAKKCNSHEECGSCNFTEGYGLKDRKGITFRLSKKGTTTTLYNSQPIMIAEHLQDIYNSGIDMIRLDFTFEKEGIREIQETYYDYANGKIDKRQVRTVVDKYKSLLENGITKGHYFRGVL